MSDLHKSKRHDLIDMFNDISRYLDDIFTIDNPEFEKYIPDILVKISMLPLDLVNWKCYCSQLYWIIISLTWTTVFGKPQYMHFATNSTQKPVLIVLIRWSRPVFLKNRTCTILERKIVNVWIGFYMIYRLHVIYSNKVLFSMFINVKYLLWCDLDYYFRLLSAFPVKIFVIAMSFDSSLVYVCLIFCRCFLFLMMVICSDSKNTIKIN